MIIVNQNHEKLQRKAATLIEALPYMHKYAGETFVVKYGGHAMGDRSLAEQFANDVALLKQVGINPVVVHGGGPQIGKMLERLSISSEFVDGLRVTDAATIEVAEMVLCGGICKQIVADLNRAGARAVGLSGKDAHLVTARKVKRTKRSPESNIEKVLDLGFVGEPDVIDARIINESIDSGMIPVISPIAPDAHGATYNINADTLAGAIAGSLKARRLIMLTDVAGVLSKDKELLTELSAADITRLIDDGTINGGMIPKVETCVQAVSEGVNGAVILDGRATHALLLEIFTERGAGTLIRA